MLGLETYKYINGNYLVHYNPYSRKLTKRGFRRGEELKASFPDSIDLKITNKCIWGCPWCHESSTKDGNSFSLERTKEVLSQLPRVPIEVAIGGGNVLDIPHETLELVDWMKDYGFLPRITINYKDIQSRWNKITDQTLNRLIHDVPSLGISLDGLPKDDKGEEINEYSNYFCVVDYSQIKRGKSLVEDEYKEDYGKDDPMYFARNTVGSLGQDVVFHIIAGLFPHKDLKILRKNFPRIPILVLGYKQWGRAQGTSLPPKLPEFERAIDELLKNDLGNSRSVLGFDNLAIEQLNIKDKVSRSMWDKLFLGEDGSHSMYIDAVKGEFAVSSRSSERVSWNDIGLLDYFKSIRE